MHTLPDALRVSEVERQALREASHLIPEPITALRDAVLHAISTQRQDGGACTALVDAQATYLAELTTHRFAEIVGEHDVADAATSQVDVGRLYFDWHVDPAWIGLVACLTATLSEALGTTLPQSLRGDWRSGVAKRAHRDMIWQMTGYGRAAQQALAHAVLHPLRDPVLGLYAREALDDMLRQATERARRHGAKLIVALARVDAAPECARQSLLALAKELPAALRAMDLSFVYDSRTVALVLEDLYRVECVEPLFERLQRNVAGAGMLRIGVTVFPDDHGDAAALLRHAERALTHCSDASPVRFWMDTNEVAA